MTEYEDLKIRYIEALKYRALYEKIISRDVCERFTVKDLRKKVRYLNEVIGSLQGDKKAMAAQHTTHEMEIWRLRKLIDSVKHTLLSAIMDNKSSPQPKVSIELFEVDEEIGEGEEVELDLDAPKDMVVVKEKKEDLKKQTRRHLLSELINILSSDTTKPLESLSLSTISGANPPMYKTGKLGLLPAQDSLFEIFRYSKQSEESEGAHKYIHEVQDSKIIPKQRSTTGIIIDTIEGDPLYVSSSHEDQEIIVAEEEPLEGEEASSSEMATSEAPSVANVENVEIRTTVTLQPNFSKRHSKSRASTRSSHKGVSIDDGEDEDEENVEFFY